MYTYKCKRIKIFYIVIQGAAGGSVKHPAYVKIVREAITALWHVAALARVGFLC